MIPRQNIKFDTELVEEQQPSLTYKLDLNKNQFIGSCDELEAVRQAVYLILNTERYDYIIYSWNYGFEVKDLFGLPISYVKPILEVRIKQALIQDDRITDISAFSIESEKGDVMASFTVNSIYGTFSVERMVIYSV